VVQSSEWHSAPTHETAEPQFLAIHSQSEGDSWEETGQHRAEAQHACTHRYRRSISQNTPFETFYRPANTEPH